MKAIISKYHGPGNVRGARYSASNGERKVSIQADDALTSDQLHAAAVRALCVKMGWEGTLVSGGLPDNSRVWVFESSGRMLADKITVRLVNRGDADLASNLGDNAPACPECSATGQHYACCSQS